MTILSPYKSQLKWIEAQLQEDRDQGEDGTPLGIHVSTIDKYQGKENDCIILSFVRSNTEHRVRHETWDPAPM